jgi:hypothetical protein
MEVKGEVNGFISHAEGCRKRADNPFGAGSGMDARFLAGESPTTRCLLVELVPT